MAEPQFDDIAACVFDAYGTLFDFASTVARCREQLGDKADQLNTIWRAKQLEYAWTCSLMGRHSDFWHITGAALDFAFEALGIEDPALRARLMQLYLDIDSFDDVTPVLEHLREAGMKRVILSNGSVTMLVSATKHAGIGKLLDDTISIEEAGLYKPHPAAYQLAVDKLKLPAHQICFLSANGWDTAGGAAFGFQVVRVNRTGQPAEKLRVGPVAEISSLSELPALLGL
jgi:2-haloacid dehalogenase